MGPFRSLLARSGTSGDQPAGLRCRCFRLSVRRQAPTPEPRPDQVLGAGAPFRLSGAKHCIAPPLELSR
jgi:hypothetical protein